VFTEPLLSNSLRKYATIFYCLRLETPPTWRQVPVFIFPRNRVAQLYPQALGSLFVASYDVLIEVMIELSLRTSDEPTRESTTSNSWLLFSHYHENVSFLICIAAETCHSVTTL
jgi:hypothetical protein